MKRIIVVCLCVFIWNTEALAVQTCKTASIPASTPTAQFIDHGNGTVTDTKTGLMWKQCSEGLSGAACATGAAATYTWQAALLAAKALNTGGGFVGFTDWRVPNIKELSSIVEDQCSLPQINSKLFPATTVGYYWSSTPYAGYRGSNVWLISFNNGAVVRGTKASIVYVRLVRGG